MNEPAGHQRNADQIAYWNGSGGQRWADRQHTQDRVLEPVSTLLVNRARPGAGEQVVDIGCGCGATSIEIAKHVLPTGQVVGVDISAPMLARARRLAPAGSPVEFILADATVYPFESARFDLLVSRFGVMFFADPAASFANIRKGLRPGGRLTFACWRDPRDNPWTMMALQAVYRHVPRLPRPEPDDPGPFSFASEQRVHRILEQAGYSAIQMEPRDLVLDISAGGGLDAAIQFALEIGPSSRALDGHSAEVKAAAERSIREALMPFGRGSTVELGAAVWIVTAQCG